MDQQGTEVAPPPEAPPSTAMQTPATSQRPITSEQELCTFGWSYRHDLDPDSNYMDLASLLARNSRCNGGHMGCVLVQEAEPTAAGGDPLLRACTQPTILATGINAPLFSHDTSDVHAEVNAVATCARRGVRTYGATAYITMPPCKNCYMLLQAAGIRRIVSRRPFVVERIATVAAAQGIELVVIPDGPEADARRVDLVNATSDQGDGGAAQRARVEEDRRERKVARKAQYEERRLRQCLGLPPDVAAASLVANQHTGVSP